MEHRPANCVWKLETGKGDRTDPENYPPVSLLSIPRKLLKSEINTAIVNHVMSNNLITPNQWAYRKGYSTKLLLIHLTEKWGDSQLNSIELSQNSVQSNNKQQQFKTRVFALNT